MLKGLSKLSRINEYWGSSAMLTLLGVFVATSSNGTTVAPKYIIAMLLANLCSFCFSFAINDIEDAEDDALDTKKVLRNPISAKIISKKSATVFTFIIFGFSLAFYAICGIYSLMFGALALVLGFLYSWKKIRLKSMPIIDIISHALFLATLIFLASAFIATTIPSITRTLFVAGLLFIFSATEDLRNEFRDFENDKLAGLKNTVQVLSLYKFKTVIQNFSFIPILLIYLFMFMSVDNSQKLLMVLITLGGVLHLFSYSKQHHIKPHDYPYMQLLFLILGLILIIK